MIDARTTMCCIIGHPVGHSKSPQMHNAAYRALDLPFVFCAFDVTDVEKAITGVRALGIRGVVVTIPHKAAVMPYLDDIDDTAKTIGAVNTIVASGNRLTGTNTDWYGALTTLEENTTLDGKHVVILGAGGAARSLIFACRKRHPKRISVLNRTKATATSLAHTFDIDYGGSLSEEDIIRDADIIVNTTSVGMEPNTEHSPVRDGVIHKNQVVFDCVYTPKRTKLLSLAKDVGATIVTGERMVLYGGTRQFELFTGKKAPIDVMEKALEKALK
jgi:shikimate dehydrogenase